MLLPFSCVRSRLTSGFTLVELLVCIAIIALLASITMPLAEMTRRRNQEEELRHALREIRDGIDAYKRATDEGLIRKSADDSGYPPTLGVLVEGVENARSPTGGKIRFLRRIPRDPFASDDTIPAEETWGLRCYASSANEPKPGKDVFDVYSLQGGEGLNGVPYKEW